MAKKKVNKKVTEKRKTKSTKYTLNTPIVKEFIYFCAWPVDMKKDKSVVTEADFMKANGLSVKSYLSLSNFKKIDGFDEAVDTEKARVQTKRLEIADRGLIKRAEGMPVKEEALDRMGNIHSLKKELPPDTKACVEIYKIHGQYINKHEVDDKSGMAIKSISESMGDENDD